MNLESALFVMLCQLFLSGTSTIQTRAKYFLIVPYMLREAVDGRYGKRMQIEF